MKGGSVEKGRGRRGREMETTVNLSWAIWRAPCPSPRPRFVYGSPGCHLRTIGDSLLSPPIHKTLSPEVRRGLLRKKRLLVATSELE